jgi:hypothetical protein
VVLPIARFETTWSTSDQVFGTDRGLDLKAPQSREPPDHPTGQSILKGAFIGFLPITRAFAKLLSVGWRSIGSSLVPGELRTPSGPGTEGDVLAPEPTRLSMETLVRSERTPSERSVGPLTRLVRFQFWKKRGPRRRGWALRSLCLRV